MAEKIIMPKAGMSMEFGTIIEWLKEIGDKVSYGEPILEIETDKTSMQVEAMNDGYLIAKLYDAGDEVPVVTTIGYIGKKGEKAPAGDAPVAAAPAAKSAPAGKETAADTGKAYDVVVLGGGPAGYIGAIKAARMGAKTAIVEKSVLGGTCLNRGCIPTKTYLKTAETIQEVRRAADRGIAFGDTSFKVDMKKAVAHKNKVVKQLTDGVAGLMRSNKIDVYSGDGVIGKDKTVTIGGKEKIKADKVIFAGGSIVSRINLPGIDLDTVLTSDEMLDIQKVPAKLAVIGGGVIGVELASVFNALGSKVTILEMMDNIVPTMDVEVSGLLKKKLEAEGITIVNGVKIEKIEKKGKKTYVHGDIIEPVEADTVLLSIGRVPDLSGLGDTGVAVERGRVVVDDRMRTNVDWIWAPGDANGRMMLAHAAFKMAEVAVENALGEDKAYSSQYVPSCIYTHPEIGAVGMTEAQARERYDVRIGKFPFMANGRALASDGADGFVKVVVDSATGEMLGVHIIGPCAAEMINEAAALMAAEITAFEVAETVHAHPTFSEALMEAVADSIGQCLHLPPKKKK